MSGFGSTLEAAWPYAAAVLVVLGAIALGALIVILIRLAQITTKANKTFDQVDQLVEKSNKELQPALERIDPIMEKATLTIDTLNLEMLRVDAILEDVESLTNAADKTVTTVEKVTAAPTDAVAGIAERVRGKIGSRGSKGAHSAKKFVYPATAGIEQGDDAVEPAQPDSASEVDEPAKGFDQRTPADGADGVDAGAAKEPGEPESADAQDAVQQTESSVADAASQEAAPTREDEATRAAE